MVQHEDGAANSAAAAEGLALIKSFHSKKVVSKALAAAIDSETLGLQQAG